MTWRPMNTAPKDSMIILNVGLPWPVVGCWNPCEDLWVYANLQASVCDGEEDFYFENEREKAPIAWAPLPEIT